MPEKTPSILNIRPCGKCGSLEKNAKSNCKPCQYRMNTEWRKRNPDKHKTYVEKWRAANADKDRADVKAYYEKNKDQVKAKSAANYQAKKAARQQALKADAPPPKPDARPASKP